VPAHKGIGRVHEVDRVGHPACTADILRLHARRAITLPGLAARPYIEALLAVGPWPPPWRERALAARLRRQQILDRADGTAPRLIAVITEASLLYRWGTPADRQTQIGHLAAVSARPNVELRMLRPTARTRG